LRLGVEIYLIKTACMFLAQKHLSIAASYYGRPM